MGWPGCAFNSCLPSQHPLCGLAHGHPEQVSGQLRRGLRCPPRVQGWQTSLPQGDCPCPRAARCSLCTRPPPLTRPVSPALPLTLTSEEHPLQAGVPAPAVRRWPSSQEKGHLFRWSQERPEGLPLVFVTGSGCCCAAAIVRNMILWKERAGRGRKGRPCSVCCSAPAPPSEERPAPARPAPRPARAPPHARAPPPPARAPPPPAPPAPRPAL